MGFDLPGARVHYIPVVRDFPPMKVLGVNDLQLAVLAPLYVVYALCLAWSQWFPYYATWQVYYALGYPVKGVSG